MWSANAAVVPRRGLRSVLCARESECASSSRFVSLRRVEPVRVECTMRERAREGGREECCTAALAGPVRKRMSLSGLTRDGIRRIRERLLQLEWRSGELGKEWMDGWMDATMA